MTDPQLDRRPPEWRLLHAGTLNAMSRCLSVSALGAVIRIDGSALTDDCWAATRAAWRDASVADAPSDAPIVSVTAHGRIPIESTLSGLSVDVTLRAIESRAGDLLMLHAAGLAAEDGRVVALVGPSGRGKTTAARTLGREFGYISDESVGVASDGTVVAYRKPLSLVENDRLPKVQRSPSELGLRALPPAPLRLAGLVLLNRTADAVAPTLESVDPAEGIVELAQQASYLGRLPAPLHVMLAHIRAVGGVHRLTYGSAAAVTPLLRGLLRRAPSPVQTITVPAHDDEQIPDPTSRDTSRLYHRVSALDALDLEDGRVVVLTQDSDRSARVVVLDGLAPTLWWNTSRPASVAALVRAAVVAHGEPEDVDAAASVAVAIAELTKAGLLVSTTPREPGR